MRNKAKDTYAYYKKYFKMNLKSSIKKGYMIDNEDAPAAKQVPIMLTEKQYRDKLDNGLSTSDIVYGQFHKYGRNTATDIAKRLYGGEDEWNKLSVGERSSILGRISRGELSESEYTSISDRYKELRKEGKDSYQAKQIISQEYYGSK